jgi:lipoprotein-anchoring transpeptidase ErfK/SrfK
MSSVLRAGVLWGGVLFLAGCAGSPPPDPVITAMEGPVQLAQPRYDTSTYWQGDQMAGEAAIELRLSEQRAYFYKGGVLAGATPISTGRAGFETPTGTFRVQQKVANYRSSQYGSYVDAHGHIVMRDVDRKADPMPPGTRFVGARMPWFLRVTEGIGLHQGHLPGYPASHGCIRLPGSMAQLYFQAASVGTPVTIVP